MQRAVLIQNRHLIRREHLFGDGLHGDLLAVLPERGLRVEQRFLRVGVHLAQTDDALHLDRVFGNKLAVGHEVIAVDAYVHGQLRLDRVGIVIPDDVGREVLQKLCLVTARRLGKHADDGLDLVRRERRHIDILRLHVAHDHRRDVARRKRRGQRAARDLLIRHDKSGQAVRGQTAGVDLIFFKILGDIRRDLIWLER